MQGLPADRTQLPSLAAYLSAITERVLPQAGAVCQDGAASQLPLLIANVFADRIIKLHMAASHRIRPIVAHCIDEATQVAAAHASSCNNGHSAH